MLNKSCIFQKQTSRGVPRKRCSENMQQIYRRKPMAKCDFNKFAKHDCSPVTVRYIFITPFLKNTSGWLLLIFLITLSKIVQVDPAPDIKTSLRRLSVRPSDVAGTSQMKHPTTSRWNVTKTSQWCVSTMTYWNVITTSQKAVTTTPHHYVSTTSQTSLKWNTQRRLDGTSPRRLSGASPRRLIGTS